MTFKFSPIFPEVTEQVCEQILGSYLFYLSETLNQRNTIRLDPVLDSDGNQLFDGNDPPAPLFNQLEVIDNSQSIVSEPITDLSLTVRDGQTQLIRTLSFDLFLKSLQQFDPSDLV